MKRLSQSHVQPPWSPTLGGWKNGIGGHLQPPQQESSPAHLSCHSRGSGNPECDPPVPTFLLQPPWSLIHGGPRRRLGDTPNPGSILLHRRQRRPDSTPLIPHSHPNCHCEPFSEVSREKARQSALLSDSLAPPRDCFVALLLAMTTRPSWDTGSRHAILIAGDKAAAVGFCS